MTYIETLRTHNLWRRGAEIPMVDPSILGEAIDTLLAEVERLRINDACAQHTLHNEIERLRLIESAAVNLVKQKGRFNTQQAYTRLAALFAKEEKKHEKEG